MMTRVYVLKKGRRIQLQTQLTGEEIEMGDCSDDKNLLDEFDGLRLEREEFRQR
jgi:hypothetical protein